MSPPSRWKHTDFLCHHSIYCVNDAGSGQSPSASTRTAAIICRTPGLPIPERRTARPPAPTCGISPHPPQHRGSAVRADPGAVPPPAARGRRSRAAR